MARKPTTIAELAAEYRRLSNGAVRQSEMKMPERNRRDWRAVAATYRTCAEIAEEVMEEQS